MAVIGSPPGEPGGAWNLVFGARFDVLVGALALIGGAVAAVLLARRRQARGIVTGGWPHRLSSRPTAPISSSTCSSGSVGPP